MSWMGQISLLAVAVTFTGACGKDSGKQEPPPAETPVVQADGDKSGPKQLDGNETQNGDWSFAERGRSLLKDAKSQLAQDLSWMSGQEFSAVLVEAGLDMPANGYTSDDLKLRILDAINDVTEPTNTEILQYRLTSDFFLVEQNGFGKMVLMPQLYFFTNFGVDWQPQKRQLKVNQVKAMIIDKIINSLGIVSPNLAQNILDATLFVLPFPNVSPMPEDTLKIAEFDHIKTNIASILTLHINNFGKALHQTLMKNDIKLKDEFSVTTVGATELTTECPVLESEALQCDETTPGFYWHQEVVFHLAQADDKQLDVKALVFGEVNLLRSNGDNVAYKLRLSVMPGYDDYVHSIMVTSAETQEPILNLRVTDNLELSAIFRTANGLHESQGIIRFTSDPLMQLSQTDGGAFHKNAQRIFKDSHAEIMQLLGKISPALFESIVDRFSVGQDFEAKSDVELLAWYVEKIAAIKNLELEQLQDASIGIKNFDYSLPDQVFVRPAFYINFGSFEDPLEQYMKSKEVNRLIIHESAHLLGLDDAAASEFASLLLDSLYESGDSGSFIHVSEIQLSGEALRDELQKLKIQALNEELKVLRQLLIDQGYELNKELGMHKIETSAPLDCSVGFNLDRIDCSMNYSKSYKTESIAFEFQELSGRMLRVVLDQEQSLELIVIDDGHGVFEAYTSFRAKALTDLESYIEVQDALSGEVLQQIKFTFADELYETIIQRGYYPRQILQVF